MRLISCFCPCTRKGGEQDGPSTHSEGEPPAPPIMDMCANEALTNVAPVRILSVGTQPWRVASPQDQPLLTHLSPGCLTPLTWLGEGAYGCVELCRVSVAVQSAADGGFLSTSEHQVRASGELQPYVPKEVFSNPTHGSHAELRCRSTSQPDNGLDTSPLPSARGSEASTSRRPLGKMAHDWATRRPSAATTAGGASALPAPHPPATGGSETTVASPREDVDQVVVRPGHSTVSRLRLHVVTQDTPLPSPGSIDAVTHAAARFSASSFLSHLRPRNPRYQLTISAAPAATVAIGMDPAAPSASGLTVRPSAPSASTCASPGPHTPPSACPTAPSSAVAGAVSALHPPEPSLSSPRVPQSARSAPCTSPRISNELVVAVKRIDFRASRDEAAADGGGGEAGGRARPGSGPSRTKLSRMQAIELLQLARCRECPFIVRVFGCVPEEPQGSRTSAGPAGVQPLVPTSSPSCRIVMEWAEGGDLGSLLKSLALRRPPGVEPSRERLIMSEASARFYTACLLEALSFLHGKSLLHRDVKPANLLLTSDGRAKLGDLGMVCHLDRDGCAVGRAGTPNYMAPEVWAYGTSSKFSSYGANADLWSAGVVLHEMLTGHLPASHPDEYLRANWSFVPAHPAFSRELRDLLSRLLRTKPRRRLQSCAEVAAHPWFAGFDWQGLRDGTLTAPYIPAAHRPPSVTSTSGEAATSAAATAAGRSPRSPLPPRSASSPACSLGPCTPSSAHGMPPLLEEQSGSGGGGTGMFVSGTTRSAGGAGTSGCSYRGSPAGGSSWRSPASSFRRSATDGLSPTAAGGAAAGMGEKSMGGAVQSAGPSPTMMRPLSAMAGPTGGDSVEASPTSRGLGRVPRSPCPRYAGPRSEVSCPTSPIVSGMGNGYGAAGAPLPGGAAPPSQSRNSTPRIDSPVRRSAPHALYGGGPAATFSSTATAGVPASPAFPYHDSLAAYHRYRRASSRTNGSSAAASPTRLSGAGASTVCSEGGAEAGLSSLIGAVLASALAPVSRRIRGSGRCAESVRGSYPGSDDGSRSSASSSGTPRYDAATGAAGADPHRSPGRASGGSAGCAEGAACSGKVGPGAAGQRSDGPGSTVAGYGAGVALRDYAIGGAGLRGPRGECRRGPDRPYPPTSLTAAGYGGEAHTDSLPEPASLSATRALSGSSGSSASRLAAFPPCGSRYLGQRTPLPPRPHALWFAPKKQLPSQQPVHLHGRPAANPAVGTTPGSSHLAAAFGCLVGCWASSAAAPPPPSSVYADSGYGLAGPFRDALTASAVTAATGELTSSSEDQQEHLAGPDCEPKSVAPSQPQQVLATCATGTAADPGPYYSVATVGRSMPVESAASLRRFGSEVGIAGSAVEMASATGGWLQRCFAEAAAVTAAVPDVAIALATAALTAVTGSRSRAAAAPDAIQTGKGRDTAAACSGPTSACGAQPLLRCQPGSALACTPSVPPPVVLPTAHLSAAHGSSLAAVTLLPTPEDRESTGAQLVPVTATGSSAGRGANAAEVRCPLESMSAAGDPGAVLVVVRRAQTGAATAAGRGDVHAAHGREDGPKLELVGPGLSRGSKAVVLEDTASLIVTDRSSPQYQQQDECRTPQRRHAHTDSFAFGPTGALDARATPDLQQLRFLAHRDLGPDPGGAGPSGLAHGSHARSAQLTTPSPSSSVGTPSRDCQGDQHQQLGSGTGAPQQSPSFSFDLASNAATPGSFTSGSPVLMPASAGPAAGAAAHSGGRQKRTGTWTPDAADQVQRPGFATARYQVTQCGEGRALYAGEHPIQPLFCALAGETGDEDDASWGEAARSGQRHGASEHSPWRQPHPGMRVNPLYSPRGPSTGAVRHGLRGEMSKAALMDGMGAVLAVLVMAALLAMMLQHRASAGWV